MEPCVPVHREQPLLRVASLGHRTLLQYGPTDTPTWYWQSWRIRGQARKWLRCMARAKALPCGELRRVAMACRRRTVTPVTSGLPWRTHANSWPRACCSARATGRALELCHRGPGLSGKIWSRAQGSSQDTQHGEAPAFSAISAGMRPAQGSWPQCAHTPILHSRGGGVATRNPGEGRVGPWPWRQQRAHSPANLGLYT